MNPGLIEVIVVVGVQVIGLGIFIGTTKVSQSNIVQRLQRIEDKQDDQNREMSELRERVAVIESILEIKKGK